LKGLRVPLSVVARWNSDDTSRLTSNVVWVLRTRTSNASQPSESKRRELARRAERHTDRELPDVELRQLRSFVVTVDEGLLSRAAPLLGLTQSGLSRQIRALEQACGCPLLHRAANGISPTAAGDVFRAEASTVLQLADQLLTQTRHVERGIAARCRIGTIPSELSGSLLVGALRRLGESSPEIAVEVTELLTSRQIPALRERVIDVALAGAYPGLLDDPSIESLLLSEDVVECALLSSTHPLASRASLRPSDLANEPFLFVSRSTYPRLYDTVMQSLEGIGLVPLMSGSYNGPRAIWRLAADGMGWTVGARSMRTNPLPGVVAVPIEGLHIPSGIQMMWRRDEQDAGVHTVLDALRGARVA
jgi:DNA-binding transcriptional LysR family regulator